jgi:hypothetical protein
MTSQLLVFTTYLLSCIACFLGLSIIGRGVLTIAPIKFINPVQEYLAPLVGLSTLTLICSTYYRLEFLRPIHPLLITVFLISLSLFYCRKFIHDILHLRAIVFCAIVSLTILFQIARYGVYSPIYGDAIFYINVSQYAFNTHFFNNIAFPFGADPNYFHHLTMIKGWQHFNIRFGSLFFITWIENCLFLKWSFHAYPIAIVLGLVSGAYSLIGALRLIAPTKSNTLPYLVGLALGCTSNGFSWGAVSDFYPQTFGVPLCMGLIIFFCCLVLELINDANSSFKTAVSKSFIPGLFSASLIYSYSDILFSMWAALVVGFAYLTFVHIIQRKKDLLKFTYKVAIACSSTCLVTIALANAEIYRINDTPPAGAGGFLDHNVNCSCPLSSFS